MKRLLGVIAGIIIFTFTAFGAEKTKVGLVLSSGGLGTGFNHMAYEALTKLQDEGEIEFKYVEPSNINEDLQYLRDFASTGDYDIVIGMGTVVAESMKVAAKEYPEQKFGLVGATIEIPNTVTIDFAEQEMSFLAGALSAMISKTGVVGTIPAMDNRSFNRFKNGFRQGAQYVNPKVKVYNTYMPTTSSNPFNDPATGKNISLMMMDRKADVIMHVAEGTGRGLFQAAKERGVYAIGCDVDEDGVLPGTILTSVIVRIDNAVYSLVSDLIKGKFAPGYTQANLASNGVSLTDFRYTKDIIGKEKIAKLNKIKNDIIKGKIKVSE
ncbi:BMP family ABC transporter substrate-binding protein [uncultured Ilyobacter sp.]|uniref:BMP family lipoprotein n=1 Tax=uncultured Ilyobacter sp. TaxID=544433 RepID=UPI002AA86C71|nr:BMP family ABC transporter substrate-binding protein [uncultured Ilyobacter sp.]